MLNKLRRLSPRERKLLIKACVLLPLAMARVRWKIALPSSVMQPAAGADGEPPVVIGEAVRMVKAAARRIPGASCLPQSLAVHRILVGEGVATTIRIGVRKSSGALDAHAWVEYAGRPITDPPAVHQDFTVLAADSRS